MSEPITKKLTVETTAKKPAVETMSKKLASETVTLAQICTELKLDPREARERLRLAVHDPKKHPELAKGHKARSPWEWAKGSLGEKEARAVVKS